jgi:pleiotropic regulator 1
VLLGFFIVPTVNYCVIIISDPQAPHARGIMVQRRAPPKVPVPQWHPKWELGVVLSGHLGWVQAISFDPSNQWFATGSKDRTIKIWDFPKSVLGDKDCLKLTLTGHISGVRGLAVSDRHPYLFSGTVIHLLTSA